MTVINFLEMDATNVMLSPFGIVKYFSKVFLQSAHSHVVMEYYSWHLWNNVMMVIEEMVMVVQQIVLKLQVIHAQLLVLHVLQFVVMVLFLEERNVMMEILVQEMVVMLPVKYKNFMVVQGHHQNVQINVVMLSSILILVKFVIMVNQLLKMVVLMIAKQLI
jgi:hypothetical protein